MAEFRPTPARPPAQPRRPRLALLDRLLDDAPDSPVDPPLSPAAAFSAVRRSVLRDLEALLNTRRRWRSWPAGLAELELSSLGYGLPDFASGAFNDPRQRDRLRSQIEAAIRRFEPRLAEVRVRLMETGDTLDPVLRLRIEAVLHAEPAPEPIAFDTRLDATSAAVSLRERTAREDADV